MSKKNTGIKIAAGLFIGAVLATEYVCGVIQGADDETRKRCGFTKPGDGIDFHTRCADAAQKLSGFKSFITNNKEDK